MRSIIIKKLFFTLLLLSWSLSLSFGESIVLSFEETLNIANKTCFRAITAALDEKEIDLNIQDLWFELLPELGYRINLDHENNSYDYLGIGDPALSLPYTFFGDTYIEVEDESIISKSSLKQELYFRQQIFGSQIVNLVLAEKNKRLQKEIIKTQLRKYLLLELRMNYFMSILYGDAIDRLGELKQVYEIEPETTAQTRDVISSLKRRAIIDLRAAELQLETIGRRYEIALLSLLHLPLDSTLKLSTPLEVIGVDPDHDSKRALENSIEIKYSMLNRKRMESDLSNSVLDFLPMVRATISSELSDRFGVGLTAYFNGSSNYGLDLSGSILLDERILQSQTYGNVAPAESEWDVNDDLDFSISLTYSLDSILNTRNDRALIKNDILLNENQTREAIQNTLQQLAEYSTTIGEKQQSVEISESLLDVAIDLKREIDQNFTISSLSDVSFYNSLYSRIKSETSNLDFYRRQLFESFFLYQNIVEGE